MKLDLDKVEKYLRDPETLERVYRTVANFTDNYEVVDMTLLVVLEDILDLVEREVE